MTGCHEEKKSFREKKEVNKLGRQDTFLYTVRAEKGNEQWERDGRPKQRQNRQCGDK